MTILSPSSVFGALPRTNAVHVLFLIENSLPMVEHLYALQRQLLPSLLGAVRLANPGMNVQIYWETTGKTQEQMLSHQKPQRHFDDFPHIDIVGLPRNRLSPLFIRQSIELFLSGDGARRLITQHVVLVAMSDPIDDPLLPANSPSTSRSYISEDSRWKQIADSLIENGIVLHLIASPAAKMTRLFELYRKTMRAQSRQEVVPWQVTEDVQCKCHLSGVSPSAATVSASATVEWPEVISDTFDPSSISRRPKLPNRRGHSFPPTTVHNRASSPDDGLVAYDASVPLSPTASLVARMQAIHGLAKRRPEQRPRSVHTASFFSDEPPKKLQRERGPAANRDRLRNVRPIDTGQQLNMFSAATATGGEMQSPTATTMHAPGAYKDVSAPSSSSTTHSSPLGGPPTALFQIPSPSSDASSRSSKSPLWPQNAFEPDYLYALQENVTATSTNVYQSQANSIVSPQLDVTSTALGANRTATRSLGSSLTDIGLISQSVNPSYQPSPWLGPSPASYAASVPYSVPGPSSSSLFDMPSSMPSAYAPGSMGPPPPLSNTLLQRPQLKEQSVRPAEDVATRQHIPHDATANFKGLTTTATTALATPASPPTALNPASNSTPASASNFSMSTASSAPAVQLITNKVGVSGRTRARALSIPSVLPQVAGTTGTALVDGDTPFLFDPIAEARNSIRLQQAIITLDNENAQQQSLRAVHPVSTTSPSTVITYTPGSSVERAEFHPVVYPPEVSSYLMSSQTRLDHDAVAQCVRYPYPY